MPHLGTELRLIYACIIDKILAQYWFFGIGMREIVGSLKGFLSFGHLVRSEEVHPVRESAEGRHGSGFRGQVALVTASVWFSLYQPGLSKAPPRHQTFAKNQFLHFSVRRCEIAVPPLLSEASELNAAARAWVPHR